MKNIIKNKPLQFFVALTVIVLLIEVFIFNYLFFFSVSSDDTVYSLSLNDAEISGLSLQDGVYTSTDTKITIEFKDIDRSLKTIRFNTDFIKGDVISYSIDFTDDTYSSKYRYAIAVGNVIKPSDGSHYVKLDTSGNVHSLRLRLTLEQDTVVSFENEAFTANKRIPISFSLLRVIFMFSFASFLYVIFKCKAFKKSIGECDFSFNLSTTAVMLLCVLIAFIITLPHFNGLSDFRLTTGNQITKELVDAFKAGRLSLLREVEPELLALQNPYDWSQRTQAGVSYAWDHLLFEGKYYSYYGIAPVLLLFLPYNLLTGYYFPTPLAVFLFGALGLVFLALAYKKFIQKLFPKISLASYISSLLILLSSCGIWYCFVTPNFYEIAQNSGFMFVTLGAYLLFSSGIFDGKISFTKSAFSAASFALAVLCRPTTAVWCIAAVCFFIYGYAQNYKNLIKKQRIIYIISCAAPFALIGGIQMIYNYLRFSSFFDFGIQYSLTINDFTRSEFSVNMALIGFYNFLFAAPIIKPQFPFITSNFSDLGVNGYYFIANRIAVGQFFKALPMFALFAAPKTYNLIDKKLKKFKTFIWILCTVILPCTIIYSIWESGYGVRYCVDFSWQMVLGALCIIWLLHRRFTVENNCSVVRIIDTFIQISAVIAVIIGVCLTVEYISTTSNYSSSFMLYLSDIFEFWH